MEEVWAAEKNFNLCVERIFEGWYGASQCGPLNNALTPTLGLKNSFFLKAGRLFSILLTYDE